MRPGRPGREIDVGSTTADDGTWFVTAAADTDPGERFLYERKPRTLTPQYKVRERLPREHMAPMKAIRYRSSDGLEIPAFLTLPKGVAESVKIEVSFKQAIHTLGTYAYHFWMAEMTPIRRRSGDQHLHRRSVKERHSLRTW